jgi:hypothetical protein
MPGQVRFDTCHIKTTPLPLYIKATRNFDLINIFPKGSNPYVYFLMLSGKIFLDSPRVLQQSHGVSQLFDPLCIDFAPGLVHRQCAGFDLGRILICISLLPSSRNYSSVAKDQDVKGERKGL